MSKRTASSAGTGRRVADRKLIDMIGQRFGRLVVIEYLKGAHVERSGRRISKWKCRCDCGAETSVTRGNLIAGYSSSCGCLKRESPGGRRTHGHSAGGPTPMPEYEVWKGMISRCENPKHNAYHNYGARGIEVCDEWRHDYAAFFAHIGPRPTPLHTVDRIDNNLGYAPGNVRWATRAEQRLNQRPITHCRRGHELTPENTGQSTRRYCRTCSRMMQNKRKAALRRIKRAA